MYYIIYRANVLPREKQIAVVSMLAEGSSIRAIERITGVNRNTIMNLGVRVGQGCAKILDAKMRDLTCHFLQFDEIWGFIGKKEKHRMINDDPTLGDVWTFCAIDAETKLVPAFRVGKRTNNTANAFVGDVASRLKNRPQISGDGLRAYVEAVENAFGADVDFGMIIKNYGADKGEHHQERRYSAPEVMSMQKMEIVGRPDPDLISTSHIERLNGTTRLHMRRLTRLTYAFSKKLENFEAAVALHFAYYNFVRSHGSLKMTPAMAAGIERSFWTVGDLVEAAS
ncbi:MAG TPA: IS1 family transposase [Pyrinomonadaceae bacterium]|nr:IS1 family transposase [Pyrinomonadaceae bacterium]